MAEQLSLQLEIQEVPVADEVSAITAITRPILFGFLHGLKGEVVKEAGGPDKIKLFMLARVRRPGDGDIGVCFEYAVHDALRNRNPMVVERVADALRMCKVPGNDVSSILFGAEKSGALALIDTAKECLTENSMLLYGAQGRPAKLLGYIEKFAAAFRRIDAREQLPQSLSGLWKADLFTGCRDSDRWVGTTLKINRDLLEGARGLRVGIVPTHEGKSDAVVLDEHRNLVVCPLPYDRSFMQVFYQAWEVVVQFLNADARVPKEHFLPRPASRQVARYLEERREFSVTQVIEALGPLSQGNLLRTKESVAHLVETQEARTETTTSLLAPIPRPTK
jgi:hypothetical protein